MTKLSPSGIALLKRLEGTVLRKGRHVVYKDQGGKPTIGYGHLIRPGEHYDKIGIGERWATDLLKADVTRFEIAVDEAVIVPLNQNEFDALVIFAFNIGETAFRTKASAVIELNATRRAEVGPRMKLWDKITVDGKLVVSSGLVRRRAAEVKLFYTPVAPEKDAPTVEKPKAVATTKPAGCIARLISKLKGD